MIISKAEFYEERENLFRNFNPEFELKLQDILENFKEHINKYIKASKFNINLATKLAFSFQYGEYRSVAKDFLEGCLRRDFKAAGWEVEVSVREDEDGEYLNFRVKIS